MTGRIIAVFSLALLTSCGTLGERLDAINPLNLFGGPEEAETGETTQTVGQIEIVRPDDGKVDIPQVMNARLDYTPSGVIVRANGEAPTLGYHSASLRPLNFGQPDGNGTVWFEFRVAPPVTRQPGGTSFMRTLSVASFIPNSRLRTVQAVTITGSENDVTIRLR